MRGLLRWVNAEIRRSAVNERRWFKAWTNGDDEAHALYLFEQAAGETLKRVAAKIQESIKREDQRK